MSTNITDLTKQAPRSARQRLGGYVILARALDKGRASLQGKTGDYNFACPMDQQLFDFAGVAGDDVKKQLADGATDTEVVEWINAHGTQRTAEEITAWSDAQEAYTPYTDPTKREWFTGMCEAVGLDPKTATLADMLDADDKASYAA